MKTVHMNLAGGGYDIYIGSGGLDVFLNKADLSRRALILTDDGVPAEYAKRVAAAAREAYIYTVPAGEGSKSIETYNAVLTFMMEHDFTRSDCAVAVGGGVCGDLCGFCAASYMRGIDFYNVATTVLAQVDSSVGGKTAVNLGNVKNIVGAFWQPKAVCAPRDVLSTLPARQVSNGLAEALKMAVVFDEELFRVFESGEALERIEEVTARSVELKCAVVERDEREGGLRKLLNFGHTIGHGIESACGMGGLLHGECVAVGMLPMCSEKVYERLLPVLEKLSLPTHTDAAADDILAALHHDKKVSNGLVSAVFADEIGKGYIKEVPFEELAARTARICG